MLSSLVVQRPFSCKTQGVSPALPAATAGRSLQAVPVPAHPFALLGGAVQPRHHLAVQQQEQRLVRHLRSPLTRTRRHGNSSAATAAAGPLRAEPRRPALPFPAAARPPQRRPAAGPDPIGPDRPPPHRLRARGCEGAASWARSPGWNPLLREVGSQRETETAFYY